MPRLDPLGALLTALGAAALVLLPFVVLKPNRIVPGEPVAMLAALPGWGAFACQAILALAALAALAASNARVRLTAALLGVVAVALALGAAADALTPAGNRVVRVAPGAAVWVLLTCLGLLATDAITRLSPGPASRVLFLALFIGVAGLALAHGTFDNLSVMREYTVNADRFAREARQHVWLAFGSLTAAFIVALPLGILCHRAPRLRAPVLGVLNVIQTIPAIALFGILMAPLASLAAAVPLAAALGIRGVGAAPAAVALFLYSLLPIAANTVAGLKRVPRAVVEAARGMGLTEWQVLGMINRLVEPTRGRVLIDGRDTSAEAPYLLRRRVGYAIQGHGLFPHRTVRENIATVPRLLGWDEARIGARVEELLEVFQLDPATYAQAFPHQLSGGQQQRVGVARALAAEPSVLLMDEPFGALDPIIRAKAQADLLDIQRRYGTTIVLVTHDMDEAFHLGDRVAVMSLGRVLQYDRPAVLLTRPADPFVARMTGDSDRAMRLLSLTTAGEAALPGASEGPTVAASASLREVLSGLLG